jgi:F-type H+-transporting ATPase subunit a
MVATWVVMAVLVGFALFVRCKLKSFKEIPTGFQGLIEAAVEMMSNLVRSIMGEKLKFLGGYFFGVFAFIVVSNYSGLFGLRPPTSDIATTLPLGLSTFVIIHATGIKRQKGKYFKEYLKPFPIFLPMNIIAEMSRPVSLGLRLFGNVLGGLILSAIVYSMLPTALTFVLPGIIHAWFDVAVGALQAFVFTMLSLVFISFKAETE